MQEGVVRNGGGLFELKERLQKEGRRLVIVNPGERKHSQEGSD